MGPVKDDWGPCLAFYHSNLGPGPKDRIQKPWLSQRTSPETYMTGQCRGGVKRKVVQNRWTLKLKRKSRPQRQLDQQMTCSGKPALNSENKCQVCHNYYNSDADKARWHSPMRMFAVIIDMATGSMHHAVGSTTQMKKHWSSGLKVTFTATSICL